MADAHERRPEGLAQDALPGVGRHQWYRLSKLVVWRNFAEVKACFPATDKVGDKFVFDIGGNKLWLIAAIHFNVGKVFVRAVLTHRDYDKGDWK